MNTETTDHARQNAAAWAGTMAELVAALECDYDRLEELREERRDLIDAVTDAYKEREADPSSETEAAHNAAMQAEHEWRQEYGDEYKELTAAATIDGELCEDSDTARERIEESPLSVEVRSDWAAPGEDMAAGEFRILLSTGGPALQIRGELDENMEPYRAWLEYQGWGTPWTEYHGDGIEQDTLLTFCRVFCFGG